MKKKVLITSMVTIILCLCLIAGSTFALFTSTASVNVAVTSGTVDVQATITDLKIRSLQDKDWQNTTNMQGTFANKGTAAIVDGKLVIDRMTPGDAVRFTIEILDKSNVATQYRITGKSLAQATAANKDLAPALKVSTTAHGGKEYDYQKDGPVTTGWVEAEEIGFKENGDGTKTCIIVVTIRFPNGTPEHDNQYKNCVANMQFLVEAVQANGVDEKGNLIVTDNKP